MDIILFEQLLHLFAVSFTVIVIAMQIIWDKINQ